MKKKFIFFILILAGLLIRLNFGVYHHDEFSGEKHCFLKHKMTWKWYFYSPIGMSDLKIEELSKENQYEQLMFNEYIRDQNLSR